VNGEKSAPKSTVGRPFQPGADSRRGRGCKKGAANAGRPPDWLKALMAEGREKAVTRLVSEISNLDPDQLLKIVEKWAPPADAVDQVQIILGEDGSVAIRTGKTA
jgi:hypothetical protein